jgi:hypothetical protein
MRKLESERFNPSSASPGCLGVNLNHELPAIHLKSAALYRMDILPSKTIFANIAKHLSCKTFISLKTVGFFLKSSTLKRLRPCNL